MSRVVDYRKAPVATPKNTFRQDLLRGIRWGTILLLVMLFGITAYRVLYSGQAMASPVRAAEERVPVPAVQVAVPMEVGDAVPKPIEAPVVARPRQAAPGKTVNVVAEPPQRLHAPAFAPLPVIPAPKAQPVVPASNAFVAAPLPEAASPPAPAVNIAVPAAVPPAPAAAPAEENTKQGSRATRAVRSVGRLFRFGRKDDSKDEKK